MGEQLRYLLVIQWSNEDQVYIVSFPEWEADGLIGHTHGDSYEEAVRKGKEVLHILMESARAEGEPLPSPRTFVSAEQVS
jgi:predicted RNase H-like HicB family nuclease